MVNAQNIKKYLAETFVLDGKITRITEKIEVLRAMQVAGGSLSHNVGGGTKSRNIRRDEDLSIEILLLEECLVKTKIELLTHERDVKKLADAAKRPIGRAIITWRYICRLAWKDIAERAELSEIHAMREHNAAIKEMCVAMDGSNAALSQFHPHAVFETAAGYCNLCLPCCK